MKKQSKYCWFFMLVLGLFSCKNSSQLQTVPSVDVNRYMGKWYEIASYPQFFEKGCSNVSATYTLKENYVEVFNSCTKDEGKKSILGKAFIVKNSGNAKLKVQFFWPFKGDYWIIDLDKDYAWAVVSDPKQKTLWVLSRTPQMEESIYQSILQRLASKGFDLKRIQLMKQTENTK
jgi:apolipoprotein D and lipocalin family protein